MRSVGAKLEVMDVMICARGIAITLALGALVPAQTKEGAGIEAAAPAELRKARARAAVHNKRVLVVLPDADVDLAGLLRRDRTVARKFRYEFEVYSGDAKLYPSVKRPALLVEDAGGARLTSVAAASYLAEGKLRGADLLAAVEPYFCAPADAERKLAAAMVAAKKTGRNILIRFDAPW